MTNFDDLCDLHPDISAEFSGSPAVSHSDTSHVPVSHFDTSHVPSLRQTDLHNRHSSTLSKTTDLSRHDSLLSGEYPNIDVSFSVSHSTESLLSSPANIL